MYVTREIENNDYEFIHLFRSGEAGGGGGGGVNKCGRRYIKNQCILCSIC